MNIVENDINIRKNILKSNPFTFASCLIRKNILIDNNIFFPEKIYLGEDYDLWLRI
jgi:hypothetical protein